ncbi:MAG: AI-2E family transporter, partial [Desulfobacterales bacterium]|jgi:predicted PurR-regulated permease PerM
LGKAVGLFLYEQARSITANIFGFIVNFFFMLLIVFYLLIDSQRLATFIVELSPLPDDQDEKLIQKFKDMAGAILIGNGLGGLIQGTLGGIVFALFDLKSPFLWGVIMALLAFLPILGIGAVFIPASLYLFLKGRIAAGIFFIVFYILLSGGIEYFFKPKLVGTRVQMHTLLVFLSIIGGLKLFGILGIIYGPLVVTAFLTLTDIYESSYRRLVNPVQK